MLRSFDELEPREVLALAIEVEEQNANRLTTFAELFSDYDEEVHKTFERFAGEERDHHRLLVEMWHRVFGAATPRPSLKEEDVREVVEAVDLDHGEHEIFGDFGRAQVLESVRRAEIAAVKFYERAAATARNPDLRQLYLELEQMERGHMEDLEKSSPRKTSPERG